MDDKQIVMTDSSSVGQNRFLELRSPWVTVFGEHLQNAQGHKEEYWRVEKADSAIILPIHQNCLIMPPPTYRPGVGVATWDFPGGRMPKGQSFDTVVDMILQRELGVCRDDLMEVISLNSTGWPVNSSFSNQCLYGFVAHLNPDADLNADDVGYTCPITAENIRNLLQRIVCLQCRAVVLEWWLMHAPF
jgi:hypothetical protein